MIKPILTAKQLSIGLALKEFEPQIVSFEYTADGYASYVGRYKVSITPLGTFVACPFCGCQARQLHAHPTRCGLACVSCTSRAEHRADNAAERKMTRKQPAKKQDEVAAKRVSKAKATKPRKKVA